MPNKYDSVNFPDKTAGYGKTRHYSAFLSFAEREVNSSAFFPMPQHERTLRIIASRIS